MSTAPALNMAPRSRFIRFRPLLVGQGPRSLFSSTATRFLSRSRLFCRGSARPPLAPADLKGMCTSGRYDAFDEYWCAACRCAGVDYEQIQIVRTTVDRVLVRASYNGGLFAARRASEILERTEDIFRNLTTSNLKLWGGPGFTVRSGSGMVSELGSALWGTSQAALSLAAVAGGHQVALLPDAQFSLASH